MNYLALFSSTTAAVKFRKKLLQLEIPVEILPVPRTLSASCGIAVSFAWPQDPRSLVDETVSKLYRTANSKYELIYESTPGAH
ncbi:MAG: DUF3343 domain-containing protein [Desulfitobacteriia bacterium]|jgi:hypothetical protein